MNAIALALLVAGTFSLTAADSGYFAPTRGEKMLQTMPGGEIAKLDGATLFKADTETQSKQWKDAVNDAALAKLSSAEPTDADIIKRFPKNISPFAQPHGKMNPMATPMSQTAGRTSKGERYLVNLCPFCKSDLFKVDYDAKNIDRGVTVCCKKVLYRGPDYPANYDLKPNSSFKFQYLDDTIREIPCTVYTDKDGEKFDLFIENLFNNNTWVNHANIVAAYTKYFAQSGNPLYPYKAALILDHASDTYYGLPLSYSNIIHQGKGGIGLTRAEWTAKREPNIFTVTDLGVWNRRMPTGSWGWLNMMQEPIWLEPYARLRHHPAFKYYSKQKYGDENALAEKINKKLVAEIILAYKQIFQQKLIANYQDASYKDILFGAIIVKDKLMLDFAGSGNEAALFNHHYYDGMNGEGAQNYMSMMTGYFYNYMSSPTGFSALVPNFLTDTPFYKLASTQHLDLVTTRGIYLEFGDQHEQFGDINKYLKYFNFKFDDAKTTAKRAMTPSCNWPGYGVGIMSVGADGKRLQTSLHYSKATGHNGQDMLGMSAFFDGVPVLRPGGYAPWWALTSEREAALMSKMNFPNKVITESQAKGFGCPSWILNHNTARQNALMVNDVGTGTGWGDNRGSSDCVAFKAGVPGSDDAVFQVLEARDFGSFDMVKLPGITNFRRAFIGVETQERDGYVVDLLTVAGGKNHTLYYSFWGERTGDTFPKAGKTAANLAEAGFKAELVTNRVDSDNVSFKEIVKVGDHGVIDNPAVASFMTDYYRFSKLPDGKSVTRPNGEDFAKVKLNLHHIPVTGGTNIISAKSPYWGNAFFLDLPNGEQLHGKVAGFEDAMDYVIQRRAGTNLNSRFINIIDGAKLKADSPVLSVKKILENPDAAVLEIKTRDGNTDTIFYQTKNAKLNVPQGATDANYALIRRDNKGAILRMHMIGGTILEADGQKLTGAGAYNGTLVDLIGDISGDRKQAALIVKPEGNWAKAAVEGQYIMIEVTRDGKDYHKNYESYPIGTMEKLADGNLKITLATPAQFIAGYHQVMKFDTEKPNFILTNTPMEAYSNQPYYEGLKVYFPRINKYYTIQDTDPFAGGGGGCRLTLTPGSNPAADGAAVGDWYIIENIRPGLKVKVIDSVFTVKNNGKLAAAVIDETATALWKYDKANFEAGDINKQQWRASDVDAKTTDNGFIITKKADKSGGALIRYVDIEKDYPYLCMQILKAEHKGGYYSIYTPNVGGFNYPVMTLVSKILPGYYSFKGSIAKDIKNTICRFDVHGANIEFAFIGMFDKPEYIVYTNDAPVKIGDEMVINFDSLKPVDSVAVELFQTYTMPQLSINGQSKLDLTAVNAEKTKWQFKTKLESIKGQSATKPFAPGAVLIKATVNGKIDVFGTNYGTIDLK